jgi:hypothetical protein
MIDYSQANILQVSAHVVGNGVNGDKLRVSSEPLEVADDSTHSNLLRYFLSSFSTPEYYSFTSASEDLNNNVIFKLAAGMFSHPQAFHKSTISIAQHLYDVTLLPTIRSGEIFITLLSGILVENKEVKAVGVFKSESKESYLKLSTGSNIFRLKTDQGINTGKLDKGCLIINVEKESGYMLLVVDVLNKSEAQFWMNDFLMVRPRADSYRKTQSFLDLTRQYVDEMDEQFQVSKADKIDLLNRSMNFFKKKDQFDQHEFEEEVLEDPSVIESFRRYERTRSGGDEDKVNNFEISAQAVKRQARVFKSVIKLDKNFHIYIHGNRQLIERGFDEVANKHYYKLYFDHEA